MQAIIQIESILNKRGWVHFIDDCCRQVWEKPDRLNNIWIAIISCKNNEFYLFYIERKPNKLIENKFFKHKLKFYKEIIKTIKKVRIK